MFSVDKYKGLTILQTCTKVARILDYAYPIHDTSPGNSIQLQKILACKGLHDTYRLPMHNHARCINCMFTTFYKYYWATCNDDT